MTTATRGRVHDARARCRRESRLYQRRAREMNLVPVSVNTTQRTTVTDDDDETRSAGSRTTRLSTNKPLASHANPFYLRGHRAALDRCPLRGDPVPEIEIDVIRYTPNRYLVGKSEIAGRKEESGGKRGTDRGNLFRIAWNCTQSCGWLRLASAAFAYDARRHIVALRS